MYSKISQSFNALKKTIAVGFVFESPLKWAFVSTICVLLLKGVKYRNRYSF